MKLKINCVIAIDAGANGGIAVFRPNMPVTTARMPKTAQDLNEYIKYWQSIAEPIVFLEKIGVRPDDVKADGDGVNMGKLFRIQKMMANFEQIKTTLELSGVPFVQVHPMKWQSGLKLRIKGEEKADRKRRYRETAQNLYKEVKATLWNADALLIMHFARYVLINDLKWVLQQMPSKDHEKLF